MVKRGLHIGIVRHKISFLQYAVPIISNMAHDWIELLCMWNLIEISFV